MITTDRHNRWQAAGHNDMSAAALEKFRKPLLHYLDSGLGDKDKWVRILAAELLGTLNDPAAGEYLTPLLADADGDVRAGAAAALDAIGHPTMGFSRLQTNGCDSCLIRLIAEEALSAGKGTGQASGLLRSAASGKVMCGNTRPGITGRGRDPAEGWDTET